MHVAEAVCCAPMTKLPIETYYDRWCRSDKLTIMGGLIQSLLSPATATVDDLNAYLDHFFKAVAPGGASSCRWRTRPRPTRTSTGWRWWASASRRKAGCRSRPAACGP